MTDALSRFLDVLLPFGGHMVAMVETYFDESEAGNERILCVAGYIFKKESAQKLAPAWNAILEPHGIKIFHMVDCAHGLGEFAHLKNNKDVRVQIQTELFDLLKLRMEVGFAVSIDLAHTHLLPSAKHLEIEVLSAYSLCCYWCLMFARKWANDKHYKGEIAYFFEAGHANQGEANRVINTLGSELADIYRYGGHAFLPKHKAPPLQCADILAWQWRKNVVERGKGNLKPRADLWSLLQRPHFTMHFDEKALTEFRETLRAFNDKNPEKA